MTILDQIAKKIILEQELIIGPVAWTEADKVEGIHIIDPTKGLLSLEGKDNREVINQLVQQYEQFFGKASHEVCKEAASTLIADLPSEEIPSSLK